MMKYRKRLAATLLVIIAFNVLAVSEVVDKKALELDKLVYLEQNWSAEDREWFYFIDQGSRLLPYRIFVNLEQAGNQNLFREPANLLNYGLLPAAKSKLNPDGLAIGLSRNKDALGLTCAACHTQQIKYRDQFIIIDGGQSMMDLPLLLYGLEKAMQATLEDEDKYSRFRQRALGENYSKTEALELELEFKSTYLQRKKYNENNYTEVPYGYSRLDAFGAILNKGLALTGEENNFNTPDAATSYPYIWDTPQHDYVEWNGSQSNSNVGALARNVGEVIGVFGDVDTEPTNCLLFIDCGYNSSIQAKNLRDIEKKVAELHSPLWPEMFPTIDQQKAEAGRVLYKEHCSSCHLDIDRTDPKRKIKVRMSTLDEIQTDPWMARNAIFHKGNTGKFEGEPRFYSGGPVMGKEEPALFVVNNLMVGVLKNNPLQSWLAIRDAEKLGHSDAIHEPKYVDGEIIERGQEVSERALLAYKARPLNGIWTAGPYLHNGSVPNLYELLLPAAERKKTFYIGAWEFDPVKVGYVDDARPGSFLFDTGLKGNSNAGHEYGKGEYGETPFSEEEIWALIEYMKTL